MLTRRFSTMLNSSFVRSATAACAVAVAAPRFTGIKSNDPTYEDDRWLEAELGMTAEMTAEERYAANKQRELMKKVLDKARTAASADAEKRVESHKNEVDELKKQMAALSAKIAAVEKK